MGNSESPLGIRGSFWLRGSFFVEVGLVPKCMCALRDWANLWCSCAPAGERHETTVFNELVDRGKVKLFGRGRPKSRRGRLIGDEAYSSFEYCGSCCPGMEILALAIRERYLRDELPTRLGGLAANLARVKSFSNNVANREVVESLLEESKFFIEWTAMDAEVDTTAELVELQIQLAQWQRSWASIWADPAQRMKVAEQAKFLSERVLDLSGLLSETVAKPG